MPVVRAKPVVEVASATLGGLALGLPAYALGVDLAERHGAQWVESGVRGALPLVNKGWLSLQTLLRMAPSALNPQFRAHLGGAVVGTVGLAIGVFGGTAVADALWPSKS